MLAGLQHAPGKCSDNENVLCQPGWFFCTAAGEAIKKGELAFPLRSSTYPCRKMVTIAADIFALLAFANALP